MKEVVGLKPTEDSPIKIHSEAKNSFPGLNQVAVGRLPFLISLEGGGLALWRPQGCVG